MKRISKLAQTVASAQPSRPLLRPSVLLPSRPIAGPSCLPFLCAQSSRSLSSRSYATTHTVDETRLESADTLEALEADQQDLLYADTAVAAEQPNGRRPLEIPSDVVIPPNVRFEGFENVQEPTPRGFRLHTSPPSLLSPISHPLSSLAAPNPTSPNSSASALSLPPHIFAQPLRRDILHRCVVWYLALLRSGNQSTKTRSTVNYSGRKLRQQKGTGKARVGDASSGMRRGGAPIFALHPRDHTQLLPRKVRALGLATALSSKLSAGLLRVVPDLNEAKWSGTAEARRALCDGLPEFISDASFLDEAAEPEPETTLEVESAVIDANAVETEESGLIRRFGTPSDLSILFVHPPPSSNAELENLEAFTRSVRNLPGVEVLGMDEVEVYHVLKYKWCVLERGVVDGITEMEEGAAGEEVFSMEGMEQALGDMQGEDGRVVI